jgi:chloride channel protein, CIC family
MKAWIGKHTFLLNWLQNKLSERQFLMLSSALVGLSAGLAAIVLKTFVHYIHRSLTTDYHLPFQYYLYLIFPLLGLLLSVFYVQRVHQGSLEKSTAFVLYSISKKSSLLAPLHMVAHVITSAITIGFGGSSGLEAPIATTGSAIGSNFARTYHLNYKQRTLLLSCGAAAGVAAAFNAPIAGVLFSIEVLLVDVSATAFIPLIISAAMGALCSNMILNEGILLSFSLQRSFDFTYIPYYLLLALAAGLVSVYHTKMFMQIDGWFEKMKRPYMKACVGGIVLAVLIFIFPPLFGEGYASINTLSRLHPEVLLNNSVFKTFSDNEWLVLLFLGTIVFAKAVATGVTLSGGGNGGNFAPSLMTGAFLGMFFSRFINLTGFTKLPESNFTLVAMAGVMSGVMHAPLTAIFLIAEVTGGYGLMIPLMLVASVSYTVVKFLAPDSIDKQKLAKRGEFLEHDRDKKILSAISLTNLIETNFQPINENALLRELITVIEKSKRNIFPVLTNEGKLTGIIQLDSIREIIFHQELYDKVLVKELIQKVPATIQTDEPMESVMKKFDETGAWNLPVLSEGKYAGFISKSSIFNKYRNQLIERSLQ